MQRAGVPRSAHHRCRSPGRARRPASALPPAQALCSWLAAANSGYCATQLLSAPLSQARMARLVKLLDLLSLPLSAAVPVPPNEPDSTLRCSAILFFLQLTVGVAVPLLFLTATEWREAPSVLPPPPPSLPAAKRVQQQVARVAAAANWAVWRCTVLVVNLPGLVGWWLVINLAWSLTLWVRCGGRADGQRQGMCVAPRSTDTHPSSPPAAAV